MEWLSDLVSGLGTAGSGGEAGIFAYFTFLIRILLPILAILILVRCIRSYMQEGHEDEVWGYLSLPNGSRIQLNHWENIIGRAKASDVMLEYPTISRSHAAIIRDDKGRWSVYDLASKGGVALNGKKIDGSAPVKSGDLLVLGGVEMVFVSNTKDEELMQAQHRSRPGKVIKSSVTFFLLTEFQILLGVQLCISQGRELTLALPISFGCLILMMWLFYAFMRLLQRTGFEVETIAFLLSTIGLSVTATSVPGDLLKQVFLLFAGILLFLILCWFLRDLDRAKKMRWPIAAAGVFFLAINLVFSEVVFGAKNWLSIGGVSFQPSEFVKLAFVFAGAATLDRLFAKRNLLLFIGFAGACVGALALMSDFGTAAVFFAAYLVIAFLRSGNIATVFLSVAGTAFAGVIAVSARPYIISRFASWGHAWEFANDSGYQQTRTLSAAASGGLFGVGAGNGWLHQVVAADTDMVFGIVSEELGLLIGLVILAGIVVLAVFSIKSASAARSSFYVIGACAASVILLFQVILNVFGSLDILPFTGVTFPFVSKGGSSLIACWGLLAFIKAADTRQNASIAIRLPGSRKERKQVSAE